MTEMEWLRCRSPLELLVWIRRSANGRRCRLFNVACCRRVESLLSEPSDVRCLELMEAFADGLGTNPSATVAAAAQSAARDLHAAFPRGSRRKWSLSQYLVTAGRAKVLNAVAACARMTCEACWESLVAYRYTQVWQNRREERAARLARQGEREVRAHIVRDVFRNPFRTVRLEPKWLSSTVVALANGIYQTRAFDGMPILADALQEAGCDNDDILNHCRGPGPHVRGCWVVDLILEKA